ncbi:MAG: Crp/Fnr family transcriptional regulator [Bacteroidetes bacterium]|nr:Crp/Fnr family transcriptional regulator [Bacteroidota bacterium]
MRTIQVKKGEILQRNGDLNSKVYIVESGLLRSYSIDQKGKEHIYMFAPEGWIVADATDEKLPSELFIDALEDSVVQVMDKDMPVPIVDHKPLLKRIAVLQKRILMLMSSSAIERYQHFVETYPNIIQRVPQKMVASYLGITPEALSKVKGDQSRRK